MGTGEIILIFLIYLIFFGAKGIPSLARNMGQAIRYFREATNDIQRDIMDSANDVKKHTTNVRREIERPMEDPVEDKNRSNQPKKSGPLDQDQKQQESPKESDDKQKGQ